MNFDFNQLINGTLGIEVYKTQFEIATKDMSTKEKKEYAQKDLNTLNSLYSNIQPMYQQRGTLLDFDKFFNKQTLGKQFEEFKNMTESVNKIANSTNDIIENYKKFLVGIITK
jgi:hypothetical protein